jgi:hypothetical protein
MANNKKLTKEEETHAKMNLAIIAAEELALSLVPLLIAVDEAGGMAKSISILKAAKERK